MTMTFSSGLDRLTEHNASFDKGILRICYTNENRNGSFISKETIERCLPSIYNCPIVCNYDREADEIGSHDIELVRDKNGDFKLVNITTPVGVIPESSQTFWELVEEDDGQIHEYLCAEVILWKRQEAYQKIKDDGITDHSMEITVQEGSLKDGLFVVDRFEFTAFCLLGTAEPCFESSALMTYSQENFKNEFAEMMRELKESMNDQPTGAFDIEPESKPEGGNEALNERIELMEQYGLTEDMIDFNLEDFTIDELKEKFEAMKVSDEPVDPVVDPVDNFALAEQFREELIGALSSETVETMFGQMSRYWYVDYNDEASEVYCYDHEDWKLYGFSYSKNGDSVSVDFESKKRMKFDIVPFDEGEQHATFAAVYSQLSQKLADANSAWESKFEESKQEMAGMQAELDELKSFKAGVEAGIAEQERNDVFAQFEDLVGIEAFETLREGCSDMSIADLEEKCFAIRGRNQTALKFSAQEPGKNPKLPAGNMGKKNDEPYGGIFAKYGIHAD